MSTSLPQLLNQADFVLDACGRKIQPANQRYVDIPSHIGYSRFLPGTVGTDNIGGVMHKGRVPFYLRAVTSAAFPRASQGAYWRLRLPNGRYFQSEATAHPMAFGIGSDRQLFSPEVEWKPGDKLFVDLDSIIAGPPPPSGYTVSMMFEGVYRFPVQGNAVAHPLDEALPRYYTNDPNQNILASEAMFAPGCPSETPAGYQDEGFTYVTPTADLNINGAVVSNVTKQIEADSDFIVRSIWPFFPVGLSNQGAGSVTYRMRRGDGYVLSSTFLPAAAVQGPIFRELKIKASDTLTYDARLVDGTGSPGNVVTVGFYLAGVKRRRAM